MMHILVFQHNDLDGYGAAAVIKNYHDMIHGGEDSIDFLEVNYAKKKIEFNRIKEFEEKKGYKYDLIYIVDLSISSTEAAKEYLKITKEYDFTIWIDHHLSSAGLKDEISEDLWGQIHKYDEEATLADCHVQYISMERSGAYLTWQYLYNSINVPKAIELIDDYDRWVHNYPESKCLNMAFYAIKELKDPSSEMWQNMLNSDNGLEEILKIGKVVKDYNDNQNDVARKGSMYITKFEGMDAACINKKMNSDIFGDAYNEYPICISYVFNGAQWVYTLYSNPKFGVDCSEIAKKYGGGGHAGAAGFTSDHFLVDPRESEEGEAL